MDEKKNTILSVIALICAVLALGFSVLNTARSAGAGPEHSGDTLALERQVEALQAEVDSLRTQLDVLVLGSGLSDWSLSAVPWEDSTGADVTLTAVPAAYEEGMAVTFSVRLSGQEVANVACRRDGESFTATAQLPGADGYSYYCILTDAEGSRQQYALSTPENPVEDIPVYLADSLSSYCNMLVDSWLDSDTDMTLTSAYIQVQLPRLSADGELTAVKTQLVLYRNGQEESRADITLESGEGKGGYELEISDLTIPLPEMGEEDYLDLWLEVTLSNGEILSTAGASWYNSPDGLYLVVG